MKVLIVSALAAAALLAGATGILRSPLTSARVETAAMSAMQQLQSGAGVDKLPAHDFEDRSLVFSAGALVRGPRPSSAPAPV